MDTVVGVVVFVVCGVGVVVAVGVCGALLALMVLVLLLVLLLLSLMLLLVPTTSKANSKLCGFWTGDSSKTEYNPLLCVFGSSGTVSVELTFSSLLLLSLLLE